MTTTTSPEGDNQVFLRGRLATDPETRTLAGGDEVCSFALSVSRAAEQGTGTDRIDCAASAGRVRRSMAKAATGDEIEVHGRLRRRFWQTPAGRASRYEVHVESLRFTRRRRSDA